MSLRDRLVFSFEGWTKDRALLSSFLWWHNQIQNSTNWSVFCFFRPNTQIGTLFMIARQKKWAKTMKSSSGRQTLTFRVLMWLPTPSRCRKQEAESNEVASQILENVTLPPTRACWCIYRKQLGRAVTLVKHKLWVVYFDFRYGLQWIQLRCSDMATWIHSAVLVICCANLSTSRYLFLLQ